MIKKGSEVLILEVSKKNIGQGKLYPDEMTEYVGTKAIVEIRKTNFGNVQLRTHDNQVRVFLRKDLKVIS